MQIENFERLCMGVSSISKSIQKIKKSEMTSLGLGGKHVMPLYYLLNHKMGLTAAELCSLCNVDKAGISRAIAEMEQKNYVIIDEAEDKKRYRSRIRLTDSGEKVAQQIHRIILRDTFEGGVTITEEDREVFYRVLDIISGNLERICETLE